MTHVEFDRILDRRLERTRLVLDSKAREYSDGDDRLHNFKRAAELLRCTPAQALVGFMTKHLVSILDMVASKTEITDDAIDEKIGDAVNYLILLEAVLRDGK